MASTLLVHVEEIAGQTFDYVIIGGGTAGLCVASRLSEDSNVTVAVLKAGKAHLNDPRIMAPCGWIAQLFNAEYDWIFPSVPHPGENNGQGTVWNRGKGLGGSSAMNILAWNRPQREDIDACEKLGNKGFNWDVFYEYSKKSERFCPPVDPIESGYRDLYKSEAVGHDAPIPISFSTITGASGAEYPIQESLKKYGVNTITDALSGDTVGTWKSAVIVDPETRTRSYSALGYLDIAVDRKNLKILTEAEVSKILISDGQSGCLKSTGVQFEHGGRLYEVHARREVIVCAGNVQEHVFVGENTYVMRPDSGVTSLDRLRANNEVTRLLAMAPNIDDALTMIPTGMTFLPLHTFSDRADELISREASKLSQNGKNKWPLGLVESYKVQIEMLNSKRVPDCEMSLVPWAPRESDVSKAYICTAAVLTHPFSRGTIHINSADYRATPDIVPNSLTQEIDEDILVEMFNLSRKVCETEPFRSLIDYKVPGSAKLQSDEDVRKSIRDNSVPSWHAVGSMSMLPRDKGGVIDTNFKMSLTGAQVYGTQNIRIVDASIFPLIPGVHIQASVYAIAEMAADVIKGKLVFQ